MINRIHTSFMINVLQEIQSCKSGIRVYIRVIKHRSTKCEKKLLQEIHHLCIKCGYILEMMKARAKRETKCLEQHEVIVGTCLNIMLIERIHECYLVGIKLSE